MKRIRKVSLCTSFSYLSFVLILFSVAGSATVQELQAQNTRTYINQIDTNLTYKVTKHSGVFYIGYILSMDEREILMLLPVRGRLVIPAHEIKSIEVVKEEEFDEYGEYLDPAEEVSHFVLNTNALGLKKSEVELGMSWVGPDVIFGLSDRKSIRVATSWVGHPLMATYSYQLPVADKFNMTLGIMGAWGTWVSPEESMVLPFAGMTLGTARKNITLTGGYGQFYGWGSHHYLPYFSFAGILPVERNWSLLVDSYLVREKGFYWGSYGKVSYLDYQFMAVLASRWTLSRTSHFQVGGGILGVGNELFPLPIVQYLKKF
ncbi:MAG TPA: hypothetical protein DIW47_06220 [Bacteroidetes bacterium]|nr:hypothetical protein [Bacteroidota bacterium]